MRTEPWVNPELYPAFFNTTNKLLSPIYDKMSRWQSERNGQTKICERETFQPCVSEVILQLALSSSRKTWLLGAKTRSGSKL